MPVAVFDVLLQATGVRPKSLHLRNKSSRRSTRGTMTIVVFAPGRLLPNMNGRLFPEPVARTKSTSGAWLATNLTALSCSGHLHFSSGTAFELPRGELHPTSSVAVVLYQCSRPSEPLPLALGPHWTASACVALLALAHLASAPRRGPVQRNLPMPPRRGDFSGVSHPKCLRKG